MKVIIIALSIFTLSGCASTWRGCKLYTFDKYKVMACEDDFAKEFCKGHCKKTDLGKPVDYYPRACAVNLNGKKPSVVISRDSMDCLPHEICHIEGKDRVYCAKKFPCRNDVP